LKVMRDTTPLFWGFFNFFAHLCILLDYFRRPLGSFDSKEDGYGTR